MPDKIIRNISPAGVAALEAHAAAANMTVEKFLRNYIEALPAQPIPPRQAYTLRALGPDKAHALIRRGRSGLEGQGATGVTQEQADAYQRAVLLVERNGPGDREAAIAALRSVFDDVFEATW